MSLLDLHRISHLHVALAGIALRGLLICYGEWQDAHFAVKYTDIDYTVFTDAARFVSQGQSPYDRATYRYTPLLAYILVPNIYVHPAWGKVLFSLLDIVASWLLLLIQKARGVGRSACNASLAAWLFNPFTMTVSTRGNCEAIVAAMVLGMVYAIVQRRTVLAGALYGLAVHTRIFPVFFGPALLVVLGRDYPKRAGGKDRWHGPEGGSGGDTVAARVRQRRGGRGLAPDEPASGELDEVVVECSCVWVGLVGWAAGQVNRQRVVFGAVSIVMFAALGAIFFAAYGHEFLHHTYLYHLSRTDPRHNFSVHFYATYLEHANLAGGGGLASHLPLACNVAVFIALAARFGRDLPFCLLLTTCTFVAFNKVCTAQYFVWFFMLLPLEIPTTQLRERSRAVLCAAVFVGTQLHWLGWAYTLEFLGWSSFLQVWIASIAFLAGNVWVMLELMQGHAFTPLFLAGRVQRVAKD